MDKNYIILTDSSADLPVNVIEELGLEVVPLSVSIGADTYINYPDERDIRFSDFYAILRDGANAQTSAANVDTFLHAYTKYLEAGKDILYLGFSSGLSGTVSAGQIAAAELAEKYPDRKILVVDTLCASLGQGLLVWLTAKERERGASIEEAAAYAESNKLHLCHWFTVTDLFFLKRGGRVSAATALLGSALGIKPVMHVDNEGHLINVSKARGRKNSIVALLDRMSETGIDISKQTIFISHADCADDAQYLASLIKEKFGVKDILIHFVGPVIGAHAGPGTLALFFLGTQR
jgi:DegV family protein with EDD domain